MNNIVADDSQQWNDELRGSLLCQTEASEAIEEQRAMDQEV